MTKIILLEQDFVKRVQSHKKAEDKNRVADILYFIDRYLSDAAHGTKEQLYKEFAFLLGIEESQIIDYVSTLREYAEDKLYWWLDHGVTFGHIRAANPYQTPTPYELLDWVASEYDSGEPRSISEMRQYANFGKPQRTIAQQVTISVVKALRRFTVQWPVANRNGLEADIKSAYEKWSPK